ncbi:hypothetical protein BHM03_00035504 [Ensete ventricosum]|nr:hypothetical protein BHM03_00035504 [Ensete ventricosum]
MSVFAHPEIDLDVGCCGCLRFLKKPDEDLDFEKACMLDRDLGGSRLIRSEVLECKLHEFEYPLLLLFTWVPLILPAERRVRTRLFNACGRWFRAVRYSAPRARSESSDLSVDVDLRSSRAMDRGSAPS